MRYTRVVVAIALKKQLERIKAPKQPVIHIHCVYIKRKRGVAHL